MRIYYSSDRCAILNGDALSCLAEIEDGAVQCCVTSPPYWGLRDYGVAGQLGLEKTPEEYVAGLVSVFREVRRVLRDDGTLWLNLGDCYSGNSAGGFRPGAGRADGIVDDRNQRNRNGNPCPPGLKPKDLVGIPWRVAFALQAPYYTGRIKREQDRIWLAAMIDGEGCMFIHKRRAGQSNGQGYERKNDSYGAGLEVANCHEAIVQRCLEIVGQGSICHQDKESRLKNRNQRLFRWNLRSNECRRVIREIYPYLTAKQHEARLLLGCPSSGEDAERAHAGLKNLHNGIEADIDFPAPASMFEQGFYLRQDVIWQKPNPLPESVTDRCTKAHEYVFLLAKSERYYYDAEAIKEPTSNKPVSAARRTRADFCTVGTKGIQGTSFGQSGKGMNADCKGTMRNRRDVWTVNTKPYKGVHFATFPEKLIEPMILAGTSEKGCCPKCGAPWVRVIEKGLTAHDGATGCAYPVGSSASRLAKLRQAARERGEEYSSTKRTLGWKPSCVCNAVAPVPCIVLDPFFGSGTTAVVAARLGRKCVGIEISRRYCALAKKRVQNSGKTLT